MQKLVLPINHCRITSGYKNANYKQQFGFTHYGVDMTSSVNVRKVYACGNGKVTHCGNDSLFGNTVVIVYKDVVNHENGTIRSVTARCYHLDSIRVKAGQDVTKDTVIGFYGNTGKYSKGAHLHIEFDADTRFPNYAPGIKGSGTVIKRGVDTTINPFDLFHIKADAPDFQEIIDSGYNTVTRSDLAKVPKITDRHEIRLRVRRGTWYLHTAADLGAATRQGVVKGGDVLTAVERIGKLYKLENGKYIGVKAVEVL